MRHWALALVILLAISPAVIHAHEIELSVHRQDRENVVKDTGQKVGFYLTATRGDGGTYLLELAIPSGSELAKAPRFRLELRREGKTVLRSPLQTERSPDGTVRMSLQVDDSVASTAFIVAAFDASRLSCSGMGTAYIIPTAEYLNP